MGIKVSVGHKFIIGFIAVVAVTAFVPDFIELMGVTEWLMKPLTYLTAIVIGLILGTFFTKSFARRVGHLTTAARRISGGDLSLSTHSGGSSLLRDETNELEEAIGLMSGNLRGLVENVREAVENISRAQGILSDVVAKGHGTSGEVMRGTSNIVEGAMEQAKRVEHSTLTVRAMAGLADDVAKKATETSNASQKVSSMVQRGAEATTSALEKMETIFNGIENTEAAASRLKEKLGDIPRILDVITHVARQTDLLALNATIEASKAGEHGKGFAMVAEEFRRFADNTNDSVRDVSAIVAELRKEVERVVTTASEGTSDIKGGREDLRRIREILADITRYTTDVVEKASLILGLTQDQKEKAVKTSETIEGINRITQESVRSAKQMEGAVKKHGTAINETMEASRKLSEFSKELQKVVSNFRTA